MREFLLLALKGQTSPLFSSSRKTETGLICRTISNALWTSKDIRRDTVVHVVLNGPPHPPRLLTFDGAQIDFPLGFDEHSLALAIDTLLARGKSLALHETIPVRPGLSVSKTSFEAFLKERAGTTMYFLHRKGEDIRTADMKEDTLFILGDLFGLPKKTEIFVKRHALPLRLGPKMLFSSHCPVLVHNELDRQYC